MLEPTQCQRVGGEIKFQEICQSLLSNSCTNITVKAFVEPFLLSANYLRQHLQ